MRDLWASLRPAFRGTTNFGVSGLPARQGIGYASKVILIFAFAERQYCLNLLEIHDN